MSKKEEMKDGFCQKKCMFVNIYPINLTAEVYEKTILLSLGLLTSCGSVTVCAQQSFPKLTVANDTVWYVLSTPERDNLHLTCAGEGDYVTGSAVTYANSQMWCFVASPNGQLNMLNRQAGLYLSEKAAADKYFRSTASTPETGFKLQMVESKNLYNLIDASGQVVNQCLNTEQFRLTNWEQSTDPGNLFQIEEVDVNNVALSVARNEARTLLS